MYVKKTAITGLGGLLIMLVTQSSLYGKAQLYVIDVGYGLAVHVEENSSHYLFDTGPYEAREAILRHLESKSVTRLSAIFLSHTHSDHVGSLLPIIKRIKTDAIYWNNQLPPDEKIVSLLEQAKLMVPFRVLTHGSKLQLSKNLKLTLLKSNLKTLNLNNNSLAFGINYKKFQILIPGDAQLQRHVDLAQAESEWLANTNIFVWPHHGDTLAEDFLNSFGKLEYCIISVGENVYGLPKATYQAQSRRICKTTLRTDRTGTLGFIIGRKITPIP